MLDYMIGYVKVDHFYATSGFIAGPHNGRHMCLRWGKWCWRNLFEHPQDLIVYLKNRIGI